MYVNTRYQLKRLKINVIGDAIIGYTKELKTTPLHTSFFHQYSLQIEH